jgi:hypothetical protein
MVYLVKQQARQGTYYKIGYTKSIGRFKAYITHNANVEILQVVNTYKKTKHSLEKSIHNELKSLGYEFINNYGITTEWIFVPIEKEQEFENQGLKQFKACKNRTVIAL